MSAILLDTHAVIWWSLGSPRLSRRADEAIVGHAGAVFVSAASIYEAEYRARIGRLPPLPASIREVVDAAGFLPIEVSAQEAERAARLPGAHGDPMDRIIVAQALQRDLIVVTVDPAIAMLGARTLW